MEDGYFINDHVEQFDRVICGQIEKYELPPVQYDPIHYFTDMQLSGSSGGTLVYDIECYRNYFLIAFMCFQTARVVTFELTEERKPDFQKLKWVLNNFTLVGFNNLNYDNPMLWAMVSGLWNSQLYQLSNKIVKQKRYSASKAEREWNFKIGFTDEIDVLEVAPSGRYTSLKQYAARMHVKWLQDLPFDPNKELNPSETLEIQNYCINGDCVNTAWLYSKLLKPIELRQEMGLSFGIDLRSKSDAQVAEAVVVNEVEVAKGFKPSKPPRRSGECFHYQVPSFIEFCTPELQSLLTEITNHEFVIDEGGYVEKWERKISIGRSNYKVGLGGLHSNEKRITHVATEDVSITDHDVASYYPQIIINQNLYPSHVGPEFIPVFKGIVDNRLAAKATASDSFEAGNMEAYATAKSMADSLKITINGSFGKFGNPYSRLYAPELLIQVTLTGQLSLLMLIEMCTHFNIPVVSANTDGIVIKCPRDKKKTLNYLINYWETLIEYKTEETPYRAIYSRDVNSYMALGTDNKWKAIGAYRCSYAMKEINRESLMKNPEFEICSEAVMRFLKDGTPIEKTIRNCKEPSKFIAVVKVGNGGAVKDQHWIGKTIRWYMRRNEFGDIRYMADNKLVGKTTGGYPIMTMTDLPKDVDYSWYVQRSLKILTEVGFNNKVEQLEMF